VNSETKIARVAATPLNVPVVMEAAGIEKKTSLSVCLVEVEDRAGRVGHGFTAITEEEVVAAAVNEVAAHNLLDDDALANERIWEKLYWLLSPRGQTGYASHAIAAIDVALWDLKGKVLGQPVWRLLGGARAKVPVYTTFGFGAYARDELAAAAKWWVDRGHRRLKMVVGQHALQRRDEPRRNGCGDRGGRAARARGARRGWRRRGPARGRQLQPRRVSRRAAGAGAGRAGHQLLRGAAEGERYSSVAGTEACDAATAGGGTE
jgi:L-alanine-DL-glutamate epimerase-like enolase superfamily enzyme